MHDLSKICGNNQDLEQNGAVASLSFGINWPNDKSSVESGLRRRQKRRLLINTDNKFSLKSLFSSETGTNLSGITDV